MAEIATGALTSLLPKLGRLLEEEYKLQQRVIGDINFLKAELESIQIALLKVSQAPIDQQPDIQVNLWARDVRDLSYEIEDSTDKFMVRLETRLPRKKNLFMAFIAWSLSLLTKTKIRHSIATRVSDIKILVIEVGERRRRYEIDSIVPNQVWTSTESLRLHALYNNATELVGAEHKSDELVERLMEGGEASNQQLKIVSVVGFGGLGKTSLAKIVYEKLQPDFHCSAFVSVSLSPNMVEIFKKLLQQLDKGKHGDIMSQGYWNEAQLIEELREILRHKRYIIVIDDIWDYSVWENIRHGLFENGYGSKIITTTRNVDVANQIGGVYRLKPLSPVQSRNLFSRRVYGSEEKCPPSHLTKVTETILKKCGGVPLAIITIAGILACKKRMTLDYWTKVSNSMGMGLGDIPEMKNMRRILSLSYYDLPPHLKTCLLYLALFPEDHEIVREYLIWKWVGESFVHREQGKSLYEVGENYLNELINKSMVKAVEFDEGSRVTTCRVHDMVLDLITSLSNDEHFLTAVGGQQLKPLPSKIRRLSLQTGNAEDVRLLSTVIFTHVRSVTVFEQAFKLLPAISRFPVLRALDLRDCEQVNNHLLKSICKLFHLRYLCLRRTSVTEVPEEISNLQFLQVLDISLTDVKVLPSTFVELAQLVYLNVNSWTTLPDGFGKMECLQNIPGITIRYPSMLQDLGRLTELRNLKIIKFIQSGENYEELFLECLSNLVSLEKLEVNYYLGGPDFGLASSLSPGPQRVHSIDMLRSIFYAVPCWMSSLSSLSALEITIRTLALEDLQILGSIPCLTDLYVWVLEPTGERLERLAIDNRYPFRCLSLFKFWSQDMEVVFSEGAMPNLQTLDLDFQVRKTKDLCGNFYFGLENLPLLQHVPVKIDCYLTEPGEVEAAEAALQKGVDMNLNKPTLNILKYGTMG